MIVYGVSTGEYSYYSVDCVFATRELAEAHADLLNEDEYANAEVLEFEVFDRHPTKIVWYGSRLSLHDDGSWPPTHAAMTPSESDEWEYAAPRGLTRRASVEVRYSQPYSSRSIGSWSEEEPEVMRPGTYSVDIQSLDRDAVAKTASEYVARWKAQGFKLHNAKPWV